MRLYSFAPASNRGDWAVDFAVATPAGPARWDQADDTITLAIAWDATPQGLDYGLTTARRDATAFVASTNDNSGVVAMINPGLISIMVPAAQMARFPATVLTVTLKYERASDARAATLWQGRLPIIEGFV
jgi:hypothetical protein